ncbi:T. brucei spp.-specific protein [Trypanosoma brucei gambiense DAL972]|uniref:T. brucei spp.-specific protein n=1 Tax=Trypanosoma brucei gambiense (strain MHOM/CI/86/DAL972) TaxID=679716 RepID=C9ZNC3_TRYB9|nr:T. brucei spp.-specific protein [Trypanosoma brucei gambiense DAL972]CBH10901.1 T. brucei spp.-specific protein [Trypanosoma brucei gambiense DAL972]|eukprot:XP_011773188.1 T. brucei spp.-specific protein [Trypanosoma brucei gambiense DAL972]
MHTEFMRVKMSLQLLVPFWFTLVSFASAENQQPADGHFDANSAKILCSLYTLANTVGEGEKNIVNHTKHKITYIDNATDLIKKEREGLEKLSDGKGSKDPAAVEKAKKELDEALAVVGSAKTEVEKQLGVIQSGISKVKEPARKAVGESEDTGIRKVLRSYCQTISKKPSNAHSDNENNNCRGVPTKSVGEGIYEIECRGQPKGLDHLGMGAAMEKWNDVKPKPSSPTHRNEYAETACRMDGYSTSTACTADESGWIEHYKKAIDAMKPVVDACQAVQNAVNRVKDQVQHVDAALKPVAGPGKDFKVEQVGEDYDAEKEDGVIEDDDKLSEGGTSELSSGTRIAIYVVCAVVPLFLIIVAVTIFFLRKRRPGTKEDVAAGETNGKQAPSYLRE